MKKLLWPAFLICLCFFDFAYGQNFRPSVVVQTGFSNNIKTRFKFSHLNNYFYGINDFGEFILWELKSGKQVKKLTPIVTELPSMFYVPQSSFSNDEKFILIPDYPAGNYFLYDVQADKIVYTFKPHFPQEKYTHVVFADDGSKALFFSQVGGNNSYCRVEIRMLTGKLVYNRILLVPRPLETQPLIIKILLAKSIKFLKAYPLVTAITATDDLYKIWFAPLSGNLYALDLLKAPEGELKEADFTKITVAPHQVIFSDLSINGDKIMAREEPTYTGLKDKVSLVTDTIHVINKDYNNKEKVVVSSFYSLPEDRRSNGITTVPMTTGQSMNTYFQSQDLTASGFNIVCRDLLTDKKLFSYNMGPPVLYYYNKPFIPGQLNGGYVVAISDDQSLLAESTGNMIIHDVNKRSIKTSFPIIRGNYKLNTPLFLDSSRLFIPKVYNDGFIYDLATAGVTRLKSEINCQDTAKNGINVFFPVLNQGVTGLENRFLSTDKKTLAIVNFVPDDLCSPSKNKTIEVYETGRMQLVAHFEFTDPEFSNHLSMLAGSDKKFLINYKLYDFTQKDMPRIAELKIIQKKDTFFAVNPMYIPALNSIVSILGTRSKPGHPDLLFAKWDLEGKLLSSVRYQRKKSKEEFQTSITVAQFSADNNKLLFGLADGTAGIFNIAQMMMGPTYEHGKALDVKYLNIYGHHMVMSGCFIDDDSFVTNGNDGQVNLWSISQKKLLRSINKEPVLLYGLVLSPDKKYLAGTDMDKAISLLNISTGNIDLRFLAFDYELYALINKDGYYTSNKRSNSNLTFFFKSKSYEFSQFDLYLNRPDKIIEQSGYASDKEIGYYKKAYEKRLVKMGYKENTLPPIAPDQIPEIQLSDLPGDLRETSDARLSFTLSAIDNRYPVKKVFVNVNGIPLFGVKGMELKMVKTGSVKIPIGIPLSFGTNKVEVSVMSSNGAESLTEYFSVKRVGPASKPDLYFISIGSGQFLQSKKNLKYPSKDARDLVDLFKEQAGNFGQVNSLVFQNEKVTRGALLKTKELLRKTKPDDFVMLFFAGHGMLDKNLDYFLSTYNTDFTNPALQSISYQDLESLLDSIPARNKIMFLDACNSGEVDKENAREYVDARTSVGEKVFRSASDRSVKEVRVGLDNSFTLMQTLFSDLRRSTGASVISAASAYENAVEGDQWQNGVFTYCLKRGLKDRKADLNKDGKINLSELLNYLNGEVSRLTNGNQQPTSRAENIINDPVIWR